MKLIRNYSVLLLVASIFYACGTDKETSEATVPVAEDIVQVSTAQAKQIDLQLGEVQNKKINNTLRLNGQIDVPPQNLVSISVPLGGYLKSSEMLPGTPVRKGQRLAVMEDAQYIQLQQDYLVARSKMDYASKEYERQKQLNIGKANSDKMLQQAENEFRQLSINTRALAEKLKLIGINPSKLSEQNISRSIHIYSPIDGYVSKVNLNIGKYVTPADVIFELVNPADIHLSLTVFEKDLPKIKIGQRVLAYNNSKPEQKYDTEVILVGHSLNEERSAEVHCHFEKYDRTLAPGMYMNAELQLDNQEVDALPDAAVVSFENNDYVFVMEGHHSFRLTKVDKGQSIQGFTQINTPLKGAKVVLKGAYSLLMKLKNTSEE